MTAGVVVTGTGVVTALGNSAAQLHDALCAGRTALRPTVRFADGICAGMITGEISSFEPREILRDGNLRPLDRTSQLLTAAAELALADSGWTRVMRQDHEVGLSVGTMFCSAHTISDFDRRALVEGPRYASPLDFANTVLNAAAGQAAIWHNLRGANSTISAGIVSGLQALVYAADLVHTGRVKAVLAAGVDELCFETLLGFSRTAWMCPLENARPVPFSPNRNGFALGEGAGALMLEDEEQAAARNAPVLARVCGWGSGFDLELSGEAIAAAIDDAQRDAGLSDGEVDLVSASANGSVAADRCEAEALSTVFKGSSPVPAVVAVKSLLGETLGASGALQTIAAIKSLQDGRVPGIPSAEAALKPSPLAVQEHCRELPIRYALVNSVSMDGHCCALVIGAPHDAVS